MESTFVVVDHEGNRHYSEGLKGVFSTLRKARAYVKKNNGKWDGCEGGLSLSISMAEIDGAVLHEETCACKYKTFGWGKMKLHKNRCKKWQKYLHRFD